MDIRIRRVISTIFLIIFLVLAPVLILYSLGYKYNFQKNRLEKTGVFFIKSYPKNSQIFLNGEKNKSDTPTQITRLLPKNYEVKISKEGYQPWQKSLEILPQRTTFIEDVSLFKEELAFESLLKGNFSNLVMSKNKQLFAFKETTDTGYKIWSYNSLNESFNPIYETDVQIEPQIISWSYSNKKLLVKEGDDFLIINTISPDYNKKISETSKINYEKIKWSKINDNILYGQKNGRLYEINLITPNITQIAEPGIITFHVYENNLIYIFKNNGEYYLSNYNSGEPQIVFSLPYSSNYEFSSSLDSLLVLMDKGQKLIYLLDPENENQPVKAVIKNVENFEWHDKQLIYWNRSELWVYYPESGQSILLERTSQQINNAFWHPNAVYAFAVIDSQLKIYELDSRDQRNVYYFFDLPERYSQYIFTDTKGHSLYFISEINGIVGFYKTVIQ